MASALLDEGFDLVTGGTDNHLMLADLRPMQITGKELQTRCDANHITLNKNAIPNDPEKPFVTSGIRIGTPAVTSRGFKEEDMITVGVIIAKILMNRHDTKVLEDMKKEVEFLCNKYPLHKAVNVYGEREFDYVR